MNHKIKLLMSDKCKEPLAGVIECDETFIDGLNKNRHSDKKIEEAQGRSCKDKVPVFGMVKRGGKLSIHIVDDTKGTTLKPIIDQNVVKDDSILITDDG